MSKPRSNKRRRLARQEDIEKAEGMGVERGENIRRNPPVDQRNSRRIRERGRIARRRRAIVRSESVAYKTQFFEQKITKRTKSVM